MNATGNSNPPFVIANISHLVSVKLDRTNYLLWKQQYVPILKAHDLYGFIDGTKKCPEKTISASNNQATANPLYSEWVQDQHLLSWLNATLSDGVLAQVVGLHTSQDVWLSLEKRYASLSRSHITQLKTQLQTIKKGGQSMTDFLNKIKSITDSLAACAHSLIDDDIIPHTLHGLPSEYDPIRTSIQTRSDPISVEEVHSLLLCEELHLEERLQAANINSISSPLNNSSAFVANRNNTSIDKGILGSSPVPSTNNNNNIGSNNNYRGRGRGRGRGSRGGGSYYNNGNRNFNNNGNTRPTCQICNRVGHIAIDCHNRMNHAYQGRIPPPALAAMVAPSFSPSPQTWYTDTGATNHLTSDLSNLSVHSTYNGGDKVSIGNGQEMNQSTRIPLLPCKKPSRFYWRALKEWPFRFQLCPLTRF